MAKPVPVTEDRNDDAYEAYLYLQANTEFVKAHSTPREKDDQGTVVFITVKYQGKDIVVHGFGKPRHIAYQTVAIKAAAKIKELSAIAA